MMWFVVELTRVFYMARGIYFSHSLFVAGIGNHFHSDYFQSCHYYGVIL